MNRGQRYIWLDKSDIAYRIQENWVIVILKEERMSLYHYNCGRIHQPEFPSRKKCQWCNTDIPAEILEKFQDSKEREKLLKFGLLYRFTQKL